jgi:dihydroxyacetone kinase
MCCGLLSGIAAALKDAEDELGRIDAQAGDGDHGQGMRRGSAAALDAANAAVATGAGAASVLAVAGDAWADRAGGTSGAIWGLLLRTWSNALSDSDAVEKDAAVKGARLALEGVTRLGGARLGDKTLVDALIPFVETLERQAASGKPLPEAWALAAECCKIRCRRDLCPDPETRPCPAASRKEHRSSRRRGRLSGARCAGGGRLHIQVWRQVIRSVSTSTGHD